VRRRVTPLSVTSACWRFAPDASAPRSGVAPFTRERWPISGGVQMEKIVSFARRGCEALADMEKPSGVRSGHVRLSSGTRGGKPFLALAVVRR
jgi:hypothetical protein